MHAQSQFLHFAHWADLRRDIQVLHAHVQKTSTERQLQRMSRVPRVGGEDTWFTGEGGRGQVGGKWDIVHIDT